MVFESIVADLLNRFLGDFVDNLNSSQLNIGIWGGDIKLDNLELKQTILDEFDLPVKIRYGYLSTLVLKIPWKNLYNEPLVATVDGLNLIIVPNKGIVYNAEKAKKYELDVKQKTLARLEEARKNRRKPPDSQADSFTEKMVTQIIKNLQVKISNIHVRFEDKYTNRHRPFAMGATLEKLNFETTDSNWKATIHKEAVKVIHKLVSLDNLAVYWNSDAKFFSDLSDKVEIRRKMKETIHNGQMQPFGYKYVLEPIKLEAKLKLNPKPETDGTDWNTPKIDLSVDMQKLALSVAKFQYQDLMLFLEAQERFTLAEQYLKYRPNLNEYRGHYRTWWLFAYTSILEEKVRRRRNNWSWHRMRTHRELCRSYRDAWMRHQTEKSLPMNVTLLINKAEETLDVFNVNVARQQAEMEIDRRRLKRVEDQPQGWIEWGKSWFGSSNSSKETTPAAAAAAATSDSSTSGKDIATKLQEVITPFEKTKFFHAIDYQENTTPTNYPKRYVESKFAFRLGEAAIAIEGALSLQLMQIAVAVQLRPGANAFNVHSSVQSIQMDGCGAEILRVRDASQPWLDLVLDTNPLDGKYDQLVQLGIAPISLKYHAPAVNNALEVFKPPESVRLNQLTALAMSRYEEVKTRSVTGLAHAVENRSRLFLDIKIQPATVMICEGGVYNTAKPTVVADLGLLTLSTLEEQDSSPAWISGTKDEKMLALMRKAYDKFRFRLSNIVVSMAEDMPMALHALTLPESPLHILRPTGIDIQLHKCYIDDLRLPKIRFVGHLPDIVVVISDRRLLMLIELIFSIPKPKCDPDLYVEELAPDLNQVSVKDRATMKTIMEVYEIVTESATTPNTVDRKKSRASRQQVQLELDLRLNQIGVSFYKSDMILLDISVSKLGAKLQLRTFDWVVNAQVGTVTVEMPRFKSFEEQRKHLYLLDSGQKDVALIKMRYIQANPESPLFVTEYKKTEQTIDFQFSSLNVSLHQQALMELMRLYDHLYAKITAICKRSEERIGRERSEPRSQGPSQKQLETAAERRRLRRERKMMEDKSSIVSLRIDATAGSLSVKMGSERSLDTQAAIRNVTAEVVMTTRALVVNASLQAISVEDMTPGALYKHLMAVEGNEDMLRLSLTLFNRTEAERKAMRVSDVDMTLKIRMAQMRLVFLNVWLTRLFNFIAPFQEEATRAAIQAAQAAALNKEHLLTLIEESLLRMELDIELNAPIVLVPRASSSRDAIVLLLGVVTANNHIHRHPNNPRAVIDHMDIAVTELKFGIGRMNEKATAVESGYYMLKPISFNLGLQRNLMFTYTKDIAAIFLDANIPLIEMDMSEHDYATIMLTISGNLAEGNELEPAVPPSVPGTALEPSSGDSSDKSAKTKKTTSLSRQTTSVDSTMSQGASTGASAARPPPTTKTATSATTATPSVEKMKYSASRIAFQFTLNKIVAVLYRGGEEAAKRETAVAFASLRLENMKLGVALKEDTSMSLEMTVNSLKMFDERKHGTRINQLVDKKAGHERSDLLRMRYTVDAKSNTVLDLNLSAFFMCLCPEFLGRLTRFFTVPQTLEQKQKAEQEQLVRTAMQARGIAPPPPPPPVAYTYIFNCHMQGVEALVVENSMEPETTQALILSFNCLFKTKTENDLYVMSGGIEKLKMFSSFYNMERRHEVTYEVLKPVCVKMVTSSTADGLSTDWVIKISAMELYMAPSVIRLISSVNAEYWKASGTVEDKATKEVTTAASPSITPIFKRYPNYWDSRFIEKKKYWFFQTALDATRSCEVVEETIEMDENNNATVKSITAIGERRRTPKEKARIEIERVCFTLEAGQGAVPVPLIYMDMLLSAKATGWSSALRASADVSLQMNYYNEAFSVWEPLIELVEDGYDKWARWDLKVTANGRNKLDPKDKSPAMDVKIEGERVLNITVTKSCIQLLYKLSDVFAQAAKQISPPTSRHLPGLAPFVVLNDTGILVKVANSEDIRVSKVGHSIDATPGAYIDLHLKRPWVQDEILSPDPTELSATLRLELAETVREIKVGRAETVAIPLPRVSDGGKKWRVVAETTIENGRRLVTLTSHVSVHNHLDVDMEVYSKRDATLDLYGIVPAGDCLALPIPLLFTASGEIYFRPANERCEISTEPVSWHRFGNQTRMNVRCNISEDTTQGYFFDLFVEEEKIQQGSDEISARYTLHLYHPLDFHNNLPFAVTIEQPRVLSVAAGEHVLLNAIAGMNVKLWVSHKGEMYCLDTKIPQEKKEIDVVPLTAEKGSTQFLLGIHWTYDYGALKAYLFAPFWLVNNTDKTLKHMVLTGNIITQTADRCVAPCQLRKNKIETPEDSEKNKHLPNENPLILPFPSTDLTRKKTAKVMVEETGCWSKKFALDTVGNPVRVTCRGQDRDFDLTVDIKLCKSGLTKIVTFSPYYSVSNLSRFNMQVREHEQDAWVTVHAEKSVGIWPSSKDEKLLVARYLGNSLPSTESIAFPITESFGTLAKIGGDAVGIDVSVSTSESTVAVLLSAFAPGMAPVLLMNTINIPLTYNQKEQAKRTLRGNEMAYFTWASLEEERVLELTCGDWSDEDRLEQNRLETIKPREKKRRLVYLASFLVGRQRTILLTDDADIAKTACGGWTTENVTMQYELKLYGIGISVVDNVAGKEIMYIGISSSDILWEQEVKKDRWKVFAVKYMEQLEAMYQEHLLRPKNEFLPIDNTEVNFSTMIMKDKRGHVKMKRIFDQAIWATYGWSAHRTRMQFKVQNLQIDNQLDTCVFPRMLGVVPPPRRVIVDHEPKPFIEMSMLQRQTELSTVAEMEHLRVLVQEFAIQIDQGLLNALFGLYQSEASKKPYGKEMFDEDMKLAKTKLADTALQYKSMRPKMFYNDLHISPLMIHLSFSQGGTTGDPNSEMKIQSEVVTVLLKSVGVSLTELQDVVFKFKKFERNCVFYSPDQLNAKIMKHYTMQTLKQVYVLLLGLDIIGNPFGLVRSFSRGVKDLFYQPFQGATLGPTEFMLGVSIGLNSMCGHVVGGTAGALGRITGTFGKGLAALTFDGEFQRRRQEDMNRRPHSFGEGMARAAKGVASGFFFGLSGVIMQPIEGAYDRGGIGFAQGVGKGLVGVVTRPISGVVDFATGSLESVRTAAVAYKEGEALRPPRVIGENRFIRPYSLSEALGYRIFNDTDGGEIAESDEYVTYAPLSERMVLLVTDRQLVIAKRADVMGTWTADRKMEYTKMHEPLLVKDGIKILFKKRNEFCMGYGGSVGLIATFQNAEAIQQKVLAAFRAADD